MDSFELGLMKLREIIQDREKAVELYCALCNMRWQNIASSDLIYSCSWRYAGGLVADIRGCREDYLDYYCSGCEGYITEWVEEELEKLGWKPLPYEE